MTFCIHMFLNTIMLLILTPDSLLDKFNMEEKIHLSKWILSPPGWPKDSDGENVCWSESLQMDAYHMPGGGRQDSLWQVHNIISDLCSHILVLLCRGANPRSEWPSNFEVYWIWMAAKTKTVHISDISSFILLNNKILVHFSSFCSHAPE